MRWPWSRKPKTLKLTVHLPIEWEDKIQFIKEHFPLNLEQLSTTEIVDRLSVLYAKIKSNVDSAKSLDGAFGTLDKEDQSIFGQGVAVEGTKTSLNVIDHPCRHFSSATPPHFRVGEVPGSCLKQGGKPCLFSPQIVGKCGIYQSKKAR